MLLKVKCGGERLNIVERFGRLIRAMASLVLTVASGLFTLGFLALHATTLALLAFAVGVFFLGTFIVDIEQLSKSN